MDYIRSCGWTLSQPSPLGRRSGRNLFIYALKHLHMRRNELLMLFVYISICDTFTIFCIWHVTSDDVWDILFISDSDMYIMTTMISIVMCVFYSCLHIGFLTCRYLIGNAWQFYWCNIFIGYTFLSILSDHARSFHCCEIVYHCSGWIYYIYIYISKHWLK